MTTVSIDLGGSAVKLGLMADGKALATAKMPVQSAEGLASLLPRLEPLIRGWQGQERVTGLGIAFPSLVDAARKKIIGQTGKYDDAASVDLEAWARDRFGLPMALENDANAAAIGEHAFGAARGCEDFVLMILGTGIGTAAFMEGKLIRGRHSQAGVIMGHVPARVGGRRCPGCGSFGCAEAQASTWALRQMAAESPIASPLKEEPALDFRLLRSCFDKGDPLARALFDECCEYWTNALLALVCAYDPELIVLSGGVLNWGGELYDRLREGALRRAWTAWGELRFARAEAPEASVLLGLHALAAKL